MAGREEALLGGWWILVVGIGGLYSRILLPFGEIRFVMNPSFCALIHSASIYRFKFDREDVVGAILVPGA